MFFLARRLTGTTLRLPLGVINQGFGFHGWRRAIGLLLLAWWGVGAAAAQPQHKLPTPTPVPDSLLANITQSDAERLEAAYSTLSSLRTTARGVFDTDDVAEELPELEENLHAIRHSVEETGRVIDIKQVQMCKLMLSSIQEEFTDWRAGLATARRQLEGMQRRLQAVALLPPLPHADSAAAQTLLDANATLERKRQRVGHFLATKLQTVAKLQTQVSTQYIQALELQDQVDGQLRGFSRRALGAEYPGLWASATQPAPAPESPHLQEARQRIIAYYFENNWDNWVFMALIGLVFFGWVHYSYRRLHASPLPAEEPFRYLRPWPLAATGVVVFSVAPALELHPPPVYLDVLQGLLLVSLTAVFWRSWPRHSFWSWVALLGLFVALSVINAGDATGLGTRWALLLLDVAAVGSGVFFLTRIRERVGLPKFVVPVTLLFIGLNVLAVIGNVLGRLSLAKLLSTAAIFGLTQGIGLAVFMQLLTEAFHLQMLCSRAATNGGGFNYDKIGASLLRLLSVVVGGLWLLVFTSNLALHTTIYTALSHFLTAPRLLGSTEFTFGNIVLFFLILYVSARLQQYIGYFFGEIGEDSASRHRGSWLVAVRLLLVLVGFALATTASGLPLSKIAIVFGALSVGIGLGLQSIVNNLVSGIILIFERPFHVGDFIEVAGKSGRVQDIGIRSSKLASLTGSEIIVPNGDLLSSHVINWTRTNDHIRVDLTLKLAPGTDLETDLQTARELIRAEVKSSPFTLASLPAEILLSSINGQVYELQVLFWIINIRQEQLTKSEILAGIYQRFTAHGLQLS